MVLPKEQHSPRITDLSWGRIMVEGREGPYRDAVLYPGGSKEWDWNETGTHHDPGIQKSDLKQLLDHGAEVVILSKGFHKQLQVCPETLKFLEEKDIPVHVLQTEEAIKLYNELRETEKVGGLFHSTC